MKIRYYISLAVVCSAILLGSCFQDLNQDPPFDYPEEPELPVEEDRDIVLKYTFEDMVRDQSWYQFNSGRAGNNTFTDGVVGRAYRGEGDKPYVVIRQNTENSEAAEAVANPGSFTVAFWMNTPRNVGATGIFCISHPTRFWSNLDILLENNDSETQAFFKVQMVNASEETLADRWVELRLEDMFNKWVHMAFVYDGGTSTFSIYRDGVRVAQNDMNGFGRVRFDNPGPMVIGTLPFMVEPSLTSGANAEGWAGYFNGSLDEFYFYKRVLTEAEIRNLFQQAE